MPDVRDGRVFEKVHDPSLTLAPYPVHAARPRSEEHTSELQSQSNLVCRLLLEKKKIYRELRQFLRLSRQHEPSPLARCLFAVTLSTAQQPTACLIPSASRRSPYQVTSCIGQ